uniref:Putative glycosyl hydrolase n=1 Tax=Chrysomela populi TaxID=154003 RepID=A0A0S7EF80_CHRPP
MFGVGTSAYSVEGAWDADSKSMSVWDYITHNQPETIADGKNADVTTDSYHRYLDDIAILKELGVNYYRFSLSWPRILPTGFPDQINEAGVAYYRNLIAALRANNIEPLVTIYHWDMPMNIYELGGYINDSFADWYSDYAAVCFDLFGDDVQLWTTFTEPKQQCSGGYGFGYYFPNVLSEGLLQYVCTHNILRAHAKAYRIYDERFRAKQGGKVGISLDAISYLPASDSPENITAATTRMHFEMGWFANPIFNGDYPEIMKTRIATRSAAEGRSKSRLPEFTDEEKAALNGSADFFALNTFTSSLAAAVEDPPITSPPSQFQDIGVYEYKPDEWENSTIFWLKIAPFGMRPLLNWINDHYNQPQILITENGLPDMTGTLDDHQRVSHIQSYLSYIRDAMEQDGVNVIGYTVWTLMDNFEWTAGFSQKFGLYYTDFDSPNRTRVAKQSAKWYANVCKTKCILEDDSECID